MILPDAMIEEFRRHYDARKMTEGTLPAKHQALAIMLTERRAELSSKLNAQRYDNDPESTFDPTREIAQLTAEITLLLIERGA